MLKGLLHDVRYALRLMLKTRGLTSVAVVTLALGIGANTAIFSVIDALLLRPLPYPDPERLVMVWQDLRPRGGPATEWTGPSQHFDWKAETAVFESLTSVRGWNASLSGGEYAEALPGEQTTYEYFDVLGGRPIFGRTFRNSDDIPNAPRVVVLSHRLWRQRFGADPAAIGRAVQINGERHEIIGVMPESFTPGLVSTAALWRPLRMNPVNPSRNSAVFRTIGRLKHGVTIEQARAGLAALAARLEQAHPESDSGKGINPVPLQEQRVGALRPALMMLLGAVGFVLLIACVNIANLLLSRASGRVRELAVRRALGADRRRIVRQLLTESVMLAAAGGALGLLVGVWGVSALKSIAPAGTPRIDEVGLDGTVLAFATALTLLTGLLFGSVPAWHAGREQFTSALKQGGRGQTGDGGNRARRALIVAELALALVLLVGGGLLIRTFLALQRADLGFNPRGVIAGFVLPPPAAYRTSAQRVAFYDAVRARTAALPGVTHAALSSVIPLGGDSDTSFLIEGRPAPTRSADALVTWYRVVSANYFAAMEIPLRRGRLFADREPEPTVVVNETMAKQHWPGEDPIGRRIRLADDGPWFTIVGIVADVQVRGARGANVVETYVGYWHTPEAGTNVVLKTATEPAAMAEPLRRAIKEVDPNIAVAGLASLDSLIAESNASSRFYALLVAVFAFVALVLAAVGIYGVLSYAVSRRTQEIGVRLALGAREAQIFGLVVGESLKLAAAGLALGLAGAALVGRALERLLFGVRATDVLTFAATALLLVVVAAVASYVPARRAMRTDPIEALRAE
ncbi:MAG TPA: ABC transporter permease [Vicinamibacterales bacterium]|nr:ABC transporter permease [Vicinamibacterales bacterium]